MGVAETAAELEVAVERLLAGRLAVPHDLLGPREVEGATRIRAFHPDAAAASVARTDGVTAMRRLNAAGLFEVSLPAGGPPGYRIRFRNREREWEQEDPYAFAPTVGELDLHLIGEGTHSRLWRVLGARVVEHQGVSGTAFAVWAPNALGVSLVSDANFWDARTWPMRMLGGSGVWELFCPGVGRGVRYKFLVTRNDGMRTFKADPLARAAELPPGTASIVEQSSFRWRDGAWMSRRSDATTSRAPFAAYEVHLGSWRRAPDGRMLTYREIAGPLAAHCRELGFTHVELLPVMEHPFGGSWGYQVTGYYAPTARHGTPDDFREFVDVMHRNDIGVILDWVPAHFPRDGWALARFDGTALYEHADPRRGEHPDWGTYVFNYGRNQVRNFLVANAHYWAEEFHVDGLRVDAVASMLYLDYSRQPGAWVPNIYGGKENLEAIALLREVNEFLHARRPGVITIAEEFDDLAGGDSIDRERRARVRLQMEHGVDARHPRLPAQGPGVPPVRASPDDVRADVRMVRAVRAPPVARRGRAPQGIPARQDVGRPVAALRQSAGAVRLDVGPPRQEAALHGRRARR